MNIISGLIMLVKNKGRDIGILRTNGADRRVHPAGILHLRCQHRAAGHGRGAWFLGCLFVIYIDPIFSLVNYASGGGVWDPEIRGIYALPAELRLEDVLKSVALSLSLSFIVTIFPARRAARMNPVEALRYE